MKKILIVDDDRGSRESLRQIFRQDYETLLAEGTDQALEQMVKNRVDLVISDLVMPERDGIQLLDEVQAHYPGIPVIMVSGNATIKPVVASIRKGAYDFISKPFDVAQLQKLAKRAIESSSLARNIAVLRDEISNTHPVEQMVGHHPRFTAIRKEAEQAAESDSTILILGETGTGKELLARFIHSRSKRAEEPFIVVHCSALNEQQGEVNFWGQDSEEADDRRQIGELDLADSGTIFFEEIGELSSTLQSRIHRLIENREYARYGGKRTLKTNARFIASTCEDLQTAIQSNRFRKDLHFQLNVLPLAVPPLRERSSDIPLLTSFYLNQFTRNLDSSIETIAESAQQILQDYFWPGNIRELRNLIERIVVLHRQEAEIIPEYLPEFVYTRPDNDLPTSPYCSLEDAVSRFEKQIVVNALKRADGVQTRAAEMLGTTRRILKYRIEKLGIDISKNGSD